MKYFLHFAVVVTLSALAGLNTLGQDVSTMPDNWRVKRREIEATFRLELEETAKWCQANELTSQAKSTLDWYRDIDLNRQYIFLPSEKMLDEPAGDLAGAVAEWEQKIIEARKTQAQRIFALAKAAAEENAGAFAFQCLHEALYYDPDIEEIRDVLGHRKKDGFWQIATGRLRTKQATKIHPLMDWPKKSYLVVSSDHFDIASRASEEETLFLAESLEKWHLVWQQAFFEFWNRPETPARWLAGNGNQRKSTRKFRVVFFASQEQYAQELNPKIPGIGQSTGYYNNSEETSYFFASDREHDTWIHEATHQWFSESVRSDGTQFENEHIWLCEGIAMYMESLTDFGDHVTLGGFESQRLQFALRRIRERFYVPMKELVGIGRVTLQQRQDIAKLYSQSAGMTHMLMNGKKGEHEQALVEFLKLLYQGKLKEDTFEKVLGKKVDDWDNEYAEFFADPPEIARFLSRPEKRTELALSSNHLDDSDYQAIGRCTNLSWLDLTGNRLSPDKLEKLTSCKELQQLFLTNCSFEPESLAALKSFPKLVELDLIGSTVRDHDLDDLAKCPRLRYIRLIGTKITDKGLVALAKIPGLQRLDLGQTMVTDQGVARLQNECPQLEVNR